MKKHKSIFPIKLCLGLRLDINLATDEFILEQRRFFKWWKWDVIERVKIQRDKPKA